MAQLFKGVKTPKRSLLGTIAAYPSLALGFVPFVGSIISAPLKWKEIQKGETYRTVAHNLLIQRAREASVLPFKAPTAPVRQGPGISEVLQARRQRQELVARALRRPSVSLDMHRVIAARKPPLPERRQFKRVA